MEKKCNVYNPSCLKQVEEEALLNEYNKILIHFGYAIDEPITVDKFNKLYERYHGGFNG